jgi:hypothetical protein
LVRSSKEEVLEIISPKRWMSRTLSRLCLRGRCRLALEIRRLLLSCGFSGRATAVRFHADVPVRRLCDPPDQAAKDPGIGADAIEHPLPVSSPENDTFTLQGLKMTRRAGLGKPDLASQLGDALVPEHETAHESKAGAVPEAGEHAAYGGFTIIHATTCITSL